MAIAAGTCPNCGHAEKRVLKEGRARTVFPCPECQNGRIIARAIKTQPKPEGNGEKNQETPPEGNPPKEEEKEEAPGDPPTKNEKTDGKPKGKVSSVRKVTYAKSGGKDASGISGKGKPSNGRRTTASNGDKSTEGNPTHRSSRKSPPARAKREPRKREPVKTSTPSNDDSGNSEDWRRVYPYIY